MSVCSALIGLLALGAVALSGCSGTGTAPSSDENAQAAEPAGADVTGTGGQVSWPSQNASDAGFSTTLDSGTTTAPDAGTVADAASDATTDAGSVDTPSCTDDELGFSFFVTSLKAMQRESGSANGFGGNLGGLAGADALCQRIAEYSTPCAARRQWHAFLSTASGPVHAKDRIGTGPWYDRTGRIVALTLTDLLNVRPVGADPAIANDLPNEDGIPNHDPDGTGQVDNHDFLTGTNDQGELFSNDPAYTCDDWTSSERNGSPRCGHTWPTGGGGRGGGSFGGGSMSNWMSALDEAGCAPADTSTSLVESGGPDERNPTVGSGGGYGGIYCFALVP